MRMALHLYICLQFILFLEISKGKVCREADMLKDLWRKKPGYQNEMALQNGLLWTPRTLFLELWNCTVYHGDIKIREESPDDNGFEEYVRHTDLKHLKNLRIIHGTVYLNLRHYPEVHNLSFFSGLKEIRTPGRGFILTNSKVEVIGFMNIRLDVPFIGIGYNKRLCYLENFGTFNTSKNFAIVRNKDPKICEREGKVCSTACNPRRGCWGPTSRHCFGCRHWRVGNDCVEICETRRRFFTPSRGGVCGRCHEKCKFGCFGPKRTQCHYSQPVPRNYCPNHMFFNNVSKQCENCSKLCLGDAYDKRIQLIASACSGPGNFTGHGGCSFGCSGTAFLNVSSSGVFKCSECHKDCKSSCGNHNSSTCLELKRSHNKRKLITISAFLALFTVSSLIICGNLISHIVLPKTVRSSRNAKSNGRGEEHANSGSNTEINKAKRHVKHNV